MNPINLQIMNRILLFIASLILMLAPGCAGNRFHLASDNAQALIVIEKTELPYILSAVEDLVSDIQKITGRKLEIGTEIEAGRPNLVIGTYGVSGLIDGSFAALKDQWECYAIRTQGTDLYIAGSSQRGTMFGIYYFIDEHLGVDPFYWWKDLSPETKESLVFDAIDYISEEPDFKYRGWFINDEDLMTEFMDGGGPRYIDYPFYHHHLCR
jgi:hypothetical protein